MRYVKKAACWGGGGELSKKQPNDWREKRVSFLAPSPSFYSSYLRQPISQAVESVVDVARHGSLL